MLIRFPVLFYFSLISVLVSRDSLSSQCFWVQVIFARPILSWMNCQLNYYIHLYCAKKQLQQKKQSSITVGSMEQSQHTGLDQVYTTFCLVWPLVTHVRLWNTPKEWKHIETFEMQRLRKIVRVSWTAKKANKWVLNTAGTTRKCEGKKASKKQCPRTTLRRRLNPVADQVRLG